jgi:hypothetical protein
MYTVQSCSVDNSCQFHHLPIFADSDQPLVYFRPNHNKALCEYETIIDIWSDTVHYYTSGYVRKHNGKIQFRSSESAFVDFLDFSIKPENCYSFTVRDKRKEHQFEILVEALIVSKAEKTPITVFRIKKGFYYDRTHLDIILLANLKRGIIGSHLVGLHNDGEYFLHPKGNIFLEERGFRDIEFRKIR